MDNLNVFQFNMIWHEFELQMTTVIVLDKIRQVWMISIFVFTRDVQSRTKVGYMKTEYNRQLK